MGCIRKTALNLKYINSPLSPAFENNIEMSELDKYLLSL